MDAPQEKQPQNNLKATRDNSQGPAHLRALINTPDTKILGGVANHYKGLRPYWKHYVHYNHIGSRQKIPGFIAFPFDIIKFIIKLIIGRYDLIVLNPSLTAQSLVRDGVFLYISRIFPAKVIVFFHGWEPDVAEKITRKPKLFSWTYNKADTIIVLASAFKKQLVDWGIHKPIQLTTTKFDDRLIQGRDICAREHVGTLLFLARIEKEKGIFTTLDTLKILQSTFPNLRLKVVGNGGALEEATRYAIDNEIQNVEFCGMLTGDKLSEAFMQSDIYLLPTWHGEGMPTSVLEAMAFGLPVITRPVGGVCDFFIDGQMGYLIESKNPVDFAKSIQEILNDNEKLIKISKFNTQFANANFAASKVSLNLERIFKSTLT